mgnify:CR=1 FL=1
MGKPAALALVLMTALLISGARRPSLRTGAPASPALPDVDWRHYHNYSELTGILADLEAAAPELVELISIGKSWLGNDIWALAITNETAGRATMGVLVVGYHHARERISLEVPLYIAWRLVSEATTNKTIASLLEQAVFYIIPALNPDGIAASELNPWHRKNLRPVDEDHDGLVDEDPPEDVDGDGKISFWWNDTASGFEGIDNDGDGLLNEDWPGGVDLNRNYGFRWDDPSAMSGSPDPSREDYRGPSPFSEPETQALRDFVLGPGTTDIVFAVSYHSGASCVLYPWSYTFGPCPDDEVLGRLAMTYGLVAGYPYERWAVMDYTCSGEWGDWMYAVAGALPLTVELYGMYDNGTWWDEHVEEVDGTYYFRDVWEYFNPPEGRIEDICAKNYQALLATVLELPELLEVAPGGQLREEVPETWYIAIALLLLAMGILALLILLSLPGEGTAGWESRYPSS